MTIRVGVGEMSNHTTCRCRPAHQDRHLLNCTSAALPAAFLAAQKGTSTKRDVAVICNYAADGENVVRFKSYGQQPEDACKGVRLGFRCRRPVHTA